MKICPECKTEYEDAVQVCPKDGAVLVPKRRKDPLLDTVIEGKYKILSKIGGGGMGSVYRAEHTMMKRVVAIKVLHHHLAEDEEYDQFIRRFQREARTASQIDHPNAVTIHDFGVFEDQAYLVMQFVEGQSLKKVIAQRETLAVSLACQITRQVCQALFAAHTAGIVHRDLKPDNIMVAEQPDADVSAVVLDFGIAKLLDAPDISGANVTKAGKVIGTPQYMAPEQVLGKRLDHRADIYSLGIILYEMLSGKPPFHAPSLMPLMMKHVEDEAIPLRTTRPDLEIPESIEQVVMQAIAKDPSDRQHSMREFAAQLERVESHQSAGQLDDELRQETVLGDSPKPATSLPSEEMRAGQKLSKNHLPVVGIFVALLLGLLGFYVSQNFPEQAPSTLVSLEESPTPVASPAGGLIGIGIRSQKMNDVLSVVSVTPGSPAQKSGLKSGDTIIEIDGVLTKSLTGLQAAERIRGPEGSQVKLQVTSQDSKVPRLLQITRQVVVSSSVDRLRVQSERLWLEGKGFDAIAMLKDAVDSHPNEAELHSALGVALQRTGQLKEAVSHYQRAIELDPTQSESYYNLGLSYFRLAKWDQAHEILREAIVINPNNSDAHRYLAETLLKLGKSEEALPALKEAIRLKPRDAGLHYSLGLAYGQLGLVVEAVREYKTALALNPKDSRVQRVTGTTLLLMGQTDEAKKHLQAAVTLNANDSEAHLQLGNVYVAEGRTEEGILEMQEALRLNPSFLIAKKKLAETYLALSRFDEAVPLLEAVIAEEDRDPMMSASLGWALNSLGRFNEAVPVLEHARKLDPRIAIVHYNLGTAFGNLGKFSDARDAFQEAIRLDPDSAVSHYNLAKAYEKLGEAEVAHEHYREASELSPNNALFREALARAQRAKFTKSDTSP